MHGGLAEVTNERSRFPLGVMKLLGRVSGRCILFSFLLLLVFVSVTLLTSTSRLLLVVDMPNKMKSDIFGVFKTVDNFQYSMNGARVRNSTVAIRALKITDKNTNFSHSGINHDVIDNQPIVNEKTPNTSATNSSYNSTARLNTTSANVTFLRLTPVDNETRSTMKPKRPINVLGNYINSTNNRRQPVCESCFEHDFSYVIQNNAICDEIDNGNVDLIILILTTHRNIKGRNVIRNTWLKDSVKNTGNIRHAFLLGETKDTVMRKSVFAENYLYHDIIMEDFIDSYKNLTYKTIMGFKWAATQCANARFVMKTDDDMYVNIPNLLRALNTVGDDMLKTHIIGSCNQKSQPIRNKKSKWFASNESYPDKYYPGFCSGTGYATSVSLARDVYTISPHVPFFHLEDVYVSLCVKKLGYHLRTVPGFSAGRPKLDPCIYKGSKLITAHQLSPVMLQIIWNKECQKPLTPLHNIKPPRIPGMPT